MEFYGKIIYISPVEELGEKKTKKQTVVLEEDTDREFKGGMAVDLFGDKIQLIEGCKVGHFITAHLNVRANESKTQAGRYFNSISAWRIDKKDTAPVDSAF